ncbi:response regulator [Paenibacillus sp. JX-17]|uniref:Response regulator n=1 Tax=Paenibacillus lacisoli TaxID=3064525 RepID=A0ABT9CAP0_9BACL|nr:response regulator [Paenibacillus sp. JX-17]MDO7906330.1 response regulator [Paenibacillus sp. JX-17]
MRAILIDDENPALQHLERLLLMDGRLKLTGQYTSARKGLEHMASQAVDVVFLDIGMPEMNGLEAAEFILQKDPGVHIVFVTAYSDYAVEAFELQAVDYLLKPISTGRLGKTLDRLEARYKAQNKQHSALQENMENIIRPNMPWAGLFRRLELYDPASGEPKRVKWRTQKSQELFAYLLHTGGQWVSKEQLLEVLWPEAVPDKSVTYLHTSVYQIRKLIKDQELDAVLEYNHDGYRLLRAGRLTDAEHFEQETSGHGPINEFNYDQRLTVISMYQGRYLGGHDYPWAEDRARELQTRWIRLMMELSWFEMENGRVGAAAEHLHLLQQEEPFSEEITRQLLLVYAKMKNDLMLQQVYDTLCDRLQEEMGIEPEPETRRLYEQLYASAGRSTGLNSHIG